MEFKINVKSDYGEREKIITLLTKVITIFGDDPKNLELDERIEEFLDTLRNDGRAFPGAHLTFSGTMYDATLTVDTKKEDNLFILDKMDDYLTMVKPFFTMAKTVVEQVEALGVSTKTMFEDIEEHFERRARYGYLVLDQIDTIGFAIGAIYRDDGYGVKEFSRKYKVKHGSKVYDNVADDMLKANKDKIVWCDSDEEFSNVMDMMDEELDEILDKYTKYRTCIFTFVDDDEGLCSTMAVMYSETLDGVFHIIKKEIFGDKVEALEYIDLNSDKDEDLIDVLGTSGSFITQLKAEKAFKETVRNAKGMLETLRNEQHERLESQKL